MAPALILVRHVRPAALVLRHQVVMASLLVAHGRRPSHAPRHPALEAPAPPPFKAMTVIPLRPEAMLIGCKTA